ncbi:MAG TPA: PAS domain S-box protein, partial [Rhodopila sp.]|nr:PAS domain S-box protein [Rhodopila sp.]
MAWHLIWLCLALALPVLTLAAGLAVHYVSTERTRLEETGIQTARNVASALALELTELINTENVLAHSAAVVSGDTDRIMSRAQEIHQIGIALMVYDRAGHALAGAPPLTSGAGGIMPDPALLQAVRPVVSDLRTGNLLEGPVISLTTPVRRGQNVVGFLRIEVPAARLRAKAIQTPAGTGWTVIVADHQGTIVTASPQKAAFVGQPMLPAVWAAVTHGGNGTVQEIPEPGLDDTVIVAFSRVMPVGWSVVVTASDAAARVPLTRSILALSMLALTLIGLSAILGLLYARRIAAPVVALATEAARLGRGEPVRPLTSTVSEIDFVAKALAEACAERQAMEGQLRESESHFRTMFEAAPVAVAILNSESLEIAACNTIACEHLGFTNQELVGRRISDFDVALSEEDLRDITWRLDNSTYGHEFETKHRIRSGEVRDVLVRAARVKQGERVQSYAAWIDITSRRAQDREMARMIDLQRSVLDALPAHVALLNAEGRIVVVNEAWRRFGESSGAMAEIIGVGADYLAACEPAVAAGDSTVATVVDGLKKILAGQQERVTLVYPCHAPDAVERWFHFIAVPDASKSPASAGGGAVVMHLDITQRVLAERALAESEARQRLFIDRVPAAIAVFDSDMRYLAVSRRFLTDYRLDDAGFGPTTIVGRSHYDLFPHLPKHWRAIHQRVLTEGETLSVDEECVVLTEGRTDWLRWEMAPWRRPCGSIGGAILFSEHITERKNTEAALRASEARLRLAIEAAGLGTWDQDMVADTAIWNETSFRILGLEPFEQPMPPGLWKKRVHADDRDKVERAYAAALSNDELYQCEHRILRPTGEIRWIRPLGRFIRGTDGSPIRFIGVFDDITDVKQASSAQERLLQVVEQSTDLIATTTPDGWLTYLNRSGRQMIGVDEGADIASLHFAFCVAPDSQQLFRHTALPEARSKGLWEGEMQLIDLHSGSLIDVHS